LPSKKSVSKAASSKKATQSSDSTSKAVVNSPKMHYSAPKVMPARDYLLSAGYKLNHIPVLVAAAKSKGYEVATASDWEELFKTI